ncbi:fungal-specific transcription factor domain-containing protein [Mycena alexandri]|uniref:Fungal-specific transcription factor domain-containing protein n=1 Tax=Mycena alexandri TaxID=1745969 RepID=A0AAD6TD33_9AGAR|nr:fungal-specific transcription factor domain-containing protein [Mycena alexandri]
MDAPAFSFQAGYEPSQREDDADKAAASKGPKRKRLAKACDACHRSKRRCDGTAPCSNCYFASKPCHYTDASTGRPVAAPHTGKPDASKAPRSSSARSKMYSEDEQLRPSSSQDRLDGERSQSRKRVRSDRPIAQEPADPTPAREDAVQERVAPVVLDHALTRELTNLFFTHCHPVRAVIHKPSFSASLSHNRVPSHLLFAICALAAPLSRQPRIRSTVPLRLSGRPFAHEAVSQMFDGSGNLLCDANLFTAQALCLLMAHDLVTKDGSAQADLRYRDLALQIVQALGVYTSEHPVNTPVPTAEFTHAAIERECVRRIFWVIHIMDLQVSMYTQRPVSLSDAQLRLRLPVDETSFELAVLSTLPEYFYLPPVRTHWVSELGHFIRIFSLYAQTEHILTRPDTNLSTLADLEKRGEEWVSSLPDALRFSEQNLQLQQSMFETSSNTGAWCFCCMHVYYAGFILALHVSRNSMLSYSIHSAAPISQRPQWTVTRLEMIMGMLGDRAKNSMLMGAFIWIQIKYCNRDDAQIRGWCNEYEEMWGTRIPDLIAAAIAPRFEQRMSPSFPGPPASTRLLPPAVSSQMYPLGRSLDELRLHNHDNSWSNTSHPHLQLGMGSAFGLVAGSSGNVKRASSEGDGDSSSKNGGGGGRIGESLPSLKSSGLLDSWSSTNSRTKPSPPLGMESDVRSTTLSGMPVGLQWLANESR